MDTALSSDQKPQSSWDLFKLTTFIRLFAFAKVPLLWAVRPSLIEASEKRVILKIPLIRRNQNHLGVMYFGALAMGAEASVGINAVMAIRKKKKRIDFIFKDFTANFLKRADGDVHFICDQGDQITALVDEADRSGERVHKKFDCYAIVPSKSTTEKVAEFTITLSLKKRG